VLYASSCLPPYLIIGTCGLSNVSERISILAVSDVLLVNTIDLADTSDLRQHHVRLISHGIWCPPIIRALPALACGQDDCIRGLIFGPRMLHSHCLALELATPASGEIDLLIHYLGYDSLD